MNKKGFTLIELLAIIVILAIIAVITVPLILGIIDDSSKNAAVNSAYGFRDAVQNYYAFKSLQDPQSELPNGFIYALDLPDNFSASGELPRDGWVNLSNGNVTEFSLKYGDYVVTKFENEDVVSEKSDLIKYNIPDEYQGVEYLKSDGNQYIDTGVFYNQDSSLQITEIHDTTTGSSIGVNPLVAVTNGGSSNIKRRIRYNSLISDFGSIYEKNSIYLNKNNLYVDGVNKNVFSIGEFTSNYSVILFGRRVNDTGGITEKFNGKIYDAKIWDNDVLVRNYVPVVRKSDNKPGMLDLANYSRNLFDAKTAYGNMYDNDKLVGNSSNLNEITNYATSEMIGKKIRISIDVTHVRSTRVILLVKENGTTKELSSVGNNKIGTLQGTFTPTSQSDWWKISYGNGSEINEFQNIMVNEGPTYLPYEPYKKSFYTNDGTGDFIAGPEL